MSLNRNSSAELLWLLQRKYPSVLKAFWARALGVSPTSVTQWASGKQGMGDEAEEALRIAMAIPFGQEAEFLRCIQRNSTPVLMELAKVSLLSQGTFGPSHPMIFEAISNIRRES